MNINVEGILLYVPDILVYPAYLSAHGQRDWRDCSLHVRENREMVQYLRADVFLYHRLCVGIYTVCVLKIFFWKTNNSFQQWDAG